MTSRWARYEPGRGGTVDPLTLDIRPAITADCAEIATISVERDRGEIADGDSRCERDILDQNRLLLVAATADGLAAFGRAGYWEPPAGAPDDVAPAGWYLLGVIVRDDWRRRGIGLELTRRRLDWIRDRADAAFYFANARNRPSIDLHESLGFVEVTREFTFPGATFDGGVGILFHADLKAAALTSEPDDRQ
jgi:ribosomal protein S18 acetylase RimI-like enzyme